MMSGVEFRVLELNVEFDVKSTKLFSFEAEFLVLLSVVEDEKFVLVVENIWLVSKLDEGWLVFEEVEKEKEMYFAECERVL